MVLIFAAADLSAKTAKFCTMRKFPAIRYLFELCSMEEKTAGSVSLGDFQRLLPIYVYIYML